MSAEFILALPTAAPSASTASEGAPVSEDAAAAFAGLLAPEMSAANAPIARSAQAVPSAPIPSLLNGAAMFSHMPLAAPPPPGHNAVPPPANDTTETPVVDTDPVQSAPVEINVQSPKGSEPNFRPASPEKEKAPAEPQGSAVEPVPAPAPAVVPPEVKTEASVSTMAGQSAPAPTAETPEFPEAGPLFPTRQLPSAAPTAPELARSETSSTDPAQPKVANVQVPPPAAGQGPVVAKRDAPAPVAELAVKDSTSGGDLTTLEDAPPSTERPLASLPLPMTRADRRLVETPAARTQTTSTTAAASASVSIEKPSPPADPAGSPGAPRDMTGPAPATPPASPPPIAAPPPISAEAPVADAAGPMAGSASAEVVAREAAPEVAFDRAPMISRAGAETTAQLTVQIVKRLEGRSTRFEMALTPEDLGRVEVSVEIDADGQLAARLAFDSPAAAAELRGRVDELRRQLEQAGFTIGQDALDFSERRSSSGQDERRFGQAFAGAARLNGQADTAPVAGPWIPLTLAPGRVDVKV